MPGPPPDWITTLGLIIATGSSAAAFAGALRRVREGDALGGWVSQALVGVATALSALLFVYRALVVHDGWVPLESHADGLLLLSALLGAAVLYLQWTRWAAGLGLFALPVLTLLLLWGVCASWWSLKLFSIRGVWEIVHLLSVYTGALGVAVAAAAGGLWLYIDRMLRAKDHRAERYRKLGRLGSLESIERVLTIAATVGFLLLTAGLATGVVVITDTDPADAAGWWYSPKVILAAAVWAIFALLMHLRYVPNFRGRRAAVLSIVGFVLLVAVFGIAQALPGGQERASKAEPSLRSHVAVDGSKARASHMEPVTLNLERLPVRSG